MEKSKTVGFIGGKFLPLHLGHVYAIMESSNRVDELYVILSSSKKRDRELCERDGIKYMPAEIRLNWLGELLHDLENIKLLHIEDDWGDEDYNWEEGARIIKEKIGKKVNFIFSSEPEYGARFERLYPGAQHVVIDEGRNAVPISATQIRRGLYKHWNYLPKCVQTFFTKKVAIVGTESCGKSTLVKKLAKIYNTTFVHEVGRDYCEKYSDQLTKAMFNYIAMEHFLLQLEKAVESNKILLWIAKQ